MSAEVRPSSLDPSIEVSVLWGDCLHPHAPIPASPDVLHVAYVGADADFSVGDADASEEQPAPEYLIDRAQLGTDRLPIVARDPKSGASLLVVPTGASIQAVTARGEVRSASQLLLDGSLRSNTVRGFPLAWTIAPGATAWLSYRGFTFVVRMTQPVEPIAIAPKPDWNGQRFTALSLAAHLFLLVLFYYSPPKSSAMNNNDLMSQQRFLDYVIKPNEFEIEDLPMLEDEGAKGEAAAQGEVGTLGEHDAQPVKAKKTQTASARTPNPSTEPMTRDQLAQIAGTSGIIQALKGAVPTIEGRFTATSATGSDPMTALASLMGNSMGPSFGMGLSDAIGNGRGGGGTAAGTIGSGLLGTIGRGPGGDGSGRYGTGVGGIGTRKEKVPPHIGGGKPDVIGSLSKEVIRRTIRLHTNEVRFCYESALQTKPDLQGRVAVRFIIGPTGAVQRAVVADSSVGNATLDQCIATAVARWTFPQPENGIVSVTYPFVLEQVGQ